MCYDTTFHRETYIYTVDDVTDGQFQSLHKNNSDVMAENRTDVVVGSCVERLELHFES